MSKPQARSKNLDTSDSSLERRVAKFLTDIGLEFTQQYPVGPYFVDFFLPELHLVLEAYGCHWHACPTCDLPAKSARTVQRIRERDAIRETFIRDSGYGIIVIWEHEFAQGLADQLVEKLCA